MSVVLENVATTEEIEEAKAVIERALGTLLDSFEERLSELHDRLNPVMSVTEDFFYKDAPQRNRGLSVRQAFLNYAAALYRDAVEVDLPENYPVNTVGNWGHRSSDEAVVESYFDAFKESLKTAYWASVQNIPGKSNIDVEQEVSDAANYAGKFALRHLIRTIM